MSVVSPFQLPTGIAATPDGQTVYVATSLDDSITPIDTTTLTAGTPIVLGGTGTNPEGIAVSPNGQWLYVANAGADSVSIIDVATNTVVNTLFSVSSATRGVGFTPDGQYAYVIGGTPLPVISVATQTFVVNLAAGLGTEYGGLGRFVGPPLIVPSSSPSELFILADSELDPYGFGRFIPFHGGTLMAGHDWTTTRDISLLSPGGTINVNASQSVIGGRIIGDSQLTVTGLGRNSARLTLAAISTATHLGGTRLESASLQVDGTHTSDITVTATGRLEGYGTVQNVTVEAGGYISPARTVPGTLHATNVTMAPGANLHIGAWHSFGTTLLDVSGAATINGANLEVSTVEAVPDGTTFLIVTNASGTFAGLPEGAMGTALTWNGVFRISYVGGDGNDVTITFDSPPTITGPGNQTILEDETLGPQAVTVGDILTPATSLVLTATSSDQAVVANNGIVLGGSGANRTVTISPVANASGSTLITLSVADVNGTTTSWSFTVDVTAVPDPPVITIPDLRDYTIVEDYPLGPIALTISDAESAPGDLTITVSSSNDALIPDANVVLGGTGPAYTLTATPLANATGTTIITITAFDGAATTDVTFALTVLPQPSYTNYAAGMQPFDGTIRVFDTGARRLWSSLGPVSSQVVAAAATPDGRRI